VTERMAWSRPILRGFMWTTSCIYGDTPVFPCIPPMLAFLHDAHRPQHRPGRTSGLLEYVQQMAAYENTRTTKLYDRRNDQAALEQVERSAL
jgi:hypothetical protein